MLKKSLLLVTLMASLICCACWIKDTQTEGYIAGVNYYLQHTNDALTVFKNNQSVPLPITVWIKAVPRTITYHRQADNSQTKSEVTYINKAILYYRIIKSDGTKRPWRLAKQIDMTGKDWKIDFESPVKLFGSSTISKTLISDNGDNIQTNDSILMIWYVSYSDSLTNGVNITPGETTPDFTIQNQQSSGTTYMDGSNNSISAKYVMQVKYNGKKAFLK